jgi:hypothetical protein
MTVNLDSEPGQPARAITERMLAAKGVMAAPL